MDRSLVYKSNALVEASYRLSLYEQRVLLLCITQVRRDEPLTDDKLYSVSAKDIADLVGLEIRGVYPELRAAASRLYNRNLRLHEGPTGEPIKDIQRNIRWAQRVDYHDSEGRVSLRFSRDVIPYLSQLTERFTKYELPDVASMTSVHGIRLYELLRQWQGVGRREVSIEWLREAFQLEGKHERLPDFKRWVVQVAVDQVNEHSPFWVKWKQRKTGRRVTHLIFTFGEKAAKKEKQLKQDKKLAEGSAKPSALYGIPMSLIEERARPGESYDDAALRILEEARLLLAGAE